MKINVRLVLALTLALTVGALVIGAAVPTHRTQTSQSPYLSAVSDLAVKPAEAVPCGLICFKDGPHHYICITDLEANNFLCVVSPDERHCDNLPCP